MADPNKFKSVSVPVKTYNMLVFLAKGKLTPADLTVSKTIEMITVPKAKKKGYKEKSL